MSILNLVKDAAVGSNPALALLQLLWKPLLALGIVVAVLAYTHHAGAVSGGAAQAKADQSVIAKANADRDAAIHRATLADLANADLAANDQTLRDAAAADQAARALQDAAGVKALAAAQAEAAHNRALAAQWKQLAAPILSSDRCRAAKAQLAIACPLSEF